MFAIRSTIASLVLAAGVIGAGMAAGPASAMIGPGPNPGPNPCMLIGPSIHSVSTGGGGGFVQGSCFTPNGTVKVRWTDTTTNKTVTHTVVADNKGLISDWFGVCGQTFRVVAHDVVANVNAKIGPTYWPCNCSFPGAAVTSVHAWVR